MPSSRYQLHVLNNRFLYITTESQAKRDFCYHRDLIKQHRHWLPSLNTINPAHLRSELVMEGDRQDMIDAARWFLNANPAQFCNRSPYDCFLTGDLE